MSSYTIQSTEPSNEDGYVYVDVLINDETDTRRLILPDDPTEAQAKLAEYVKAPENQPEPVLVTDTPLDALVDQTIEVK